MSPLRHPLRITLLSVAAIALALLLLLERLSPAVLPVPPRADVVLAGITVINPGVERLPDHSIVVREGRIVEVRPTRPGDPAPPCSGCYAIPGLIDAHVHTPPRVALGNQELFSLLYLAHGVTTVRDVGASEDSVARLASRLNAGELVGPRMARCGPVLDGDPPGWPMATVVNGAESGATIVDRLAAEGVDCIKVYNEMQPDGFEAIAAAARRHSLPLVGHVPHAVGLAQVSDFEAQHMTGVPYHSRPRPPHGWDLRDEDVLLLSDEEIETALRVARHRRISFTPTLANFTLRLTASDPARFPPTAAAAFLPDYWARAWDLIAGHPTTHESIERRLQTQPSMRALVRRAHDLGIDVLAGTDTIMPWVVPGESLHLEMAALQEALGSPEAALAAATTVNGRHVAPGDIGVIAAGARADVLLLREDPTERLAALGGWRMVFADGRRYDRGTVDGWLEDYRRHFRGGLYRRVVGTAVSFVVDRFEHTSKGTGESVTLAAGS
jgi:cytosine/adenosine deaminase-related metal-dependent hydrolase